MNITCRKTNCEHNKNFVCYKKNLRIGKSSLCEDYQSCDKNPPDTSKKMLKKPPKYNPYRSAKKCGICCTANCFFNNETKCQANGITVNNLCDCPYCITFLNNEE